MCNFLMNVGNSSFSHLETSSACYRKDRKNLHPTNAVVCLLSHVKFFFFMGLGYKLFTMFSRKHLLYDGKLNPRFY